MNTEIATQIITQLPVGCTVRAGKISDYLLAFDLFNAYSLHVNGCVNVDDPELIRVDWQAPGFNPETDLHTVFGPDGRLIGLVETWLNNHPPVHPFNWICVHPEYLDTGLWEYLLQHGENRSRAALDMVPTHLRVAPGTGIDHNNQAGIQAIQNLGWKPNRTYYHMRADLDSQPVVPPVPEGIVIRTYHPETETEAVYLAITEAFRDHFGFVEESFEHGFAHFKHHLIDVPGYDPDYWFVAVDGDEIAGVCICRPVDASDPEGGWVNELGVRRHWRKRGLGTILLKQAFARFYAHGQKRAGLGVDATNLTGALQLYERAGMRVARQFDNFEKEFRPGQEIATEVLA
ncbi:MAG TPA: GNAT family N-acetyltransferase [Anaerolineales bacterium]|jgi:ribosomal protein S18 acetylase RimI-like enzyme